MLSTVRIAAGALPRSCRPALLALALAVTPALSLSFPALAAPAQDGLAVSAQNGDATTPLEQTEGYRHTPAGPVSEAYGDSASGPDHLRRMSATEALPAPARVEHVLRVDPDGKIEFPQSGQ